MLLPQVSETDWNARLKGKMLLPQASETGNRSTAQAIGLQPTGRTHPSCSPRCPQIQEVQSPIVVFQSTRKRPMDHRMYDGCAFVVPSRLGMCPSCREPLLFVCPFLFLKTLSNKSSICFNRFSNDSTNALTRHSRTRLSWRHSCSCSAMLHCHLTLSSKGTAAIAQMIDRLCS